MTVIATGVARVRHATTGEVFDILPGDLEWDAEGAADRQMGPEVVHSGRLHHDELGELTWYLWEYPLSLIHI